VRVRALVESDCDWAKALVCQHFVSPFVVSRGTCHDTRTLSGLVAERDGERLGLLHYHIESHRCELVVLIVTPKRQGLGKQMLRELASVARSNGCRCLWLITTNENVTAQRFYRALGWREIAIHRGAVAESRRLKPEIPEYATDGTPIIDEIEYELSLDAG